MYSNILELCACYHQICSSKISVSGSILLTGSRVSNKPIMNPGGQRGSKNLVNLMRIGQWTVGSQITEDGKYVLLYIVEGCDPVNRLVLA